MKISIVGHCGSGKSTLARNISEKKNISHLELDRLFFLNNGAAAKDSAHKALVKEKIKADVIDFLKEHDSWVTDGVYLTSVQPLLLEAVDTIVYIDIPLWRRMGNHLKRWWKNKDRHREVSRLEDLWFVFDMPRRTRTANEKFPTLFTLAGDKLVILRSYKDVERFLNSI